MFSISFLVIPVFLSRYTLRKYSTLRLQVNHNEDSIVVERAFQNKVWKRTRKSISEAQILAYHYYIITSSFETEKSIHGNSPISSVGPVIGHITVNEQSDSVHQKYHIHGYSGEGGNWELEISKLIEGAGHDKAKEIAKYIGIEFRDDGEVQPLFSIWRTRMTIETPEFQGTHLWNRLGWAKENLEPYRTEYCVRD